LSQHDQHYSLRIMRRSLPLALMFANANRKGKHKERNRKKEETEQAAEPHQPFIEQESSNLVEDAQPDDEEENVYISDQEEEKREFYIVSEIFDQQ